MWYLFKWCDRNLQGAAQEVVDGPLGDYIVKRKGVLGLLLKSVPKKLEGLVLLLVA